MTMIAGCNLSSLELFAGAGGLALGVASAGFIHTAVIEANPTACATLRSNHAKHKGAADWKIIEQDVSEISFAEYSDLDLLSGGPPCQPFSQAGSRTGKADARDMFPEFIRAVRETQPKAFVIENVRGLMGRMFVDYFTYITLQLQFPNLLRANRERWTDHRSRLERAVTRGNTRGLHYNVVWQSLNAADFGVAQRRHRVFIVGVRSDLGIGYSFPSPTHTRGALMYDQWISERYWDRHKVAKKARPERPAFAQGAIKQSEQPNSLAWRTVRDALDGLPRIGLGRTSHKVQNHFLNPGARVYAGHTGSILDLPSKTIKAGANGVPGGENIVQLDDGTVRYYSVRECARLQGFPDEWAFDGSWCSGMRQIGNAVPITLAEAVVRPLADALLGRPSELRES